MLVVGAAVVVSALAGHRSDAWYVATGFEKQRVFDYGLWSLAAMTIGLAVLPVVATVAAFGSRRVRATAEGRAFVVVGVAACLRLRHLRRGQGRLPLDRSSPTLIVERNVIYLVPVVLAATAAVLARPIASAPALAVGFLVALFLVLKAEFRLDQYPYFEAPSLAIGALANRNFIWDAADVERALVAAALVSVALLAARSFVRSRTVGLAIAVVAACGVTTWALTTEIYAARGLNTVRRAAAPGHAEAGRLGRPGDRAASRRSSSASSSARTRTRSGCSSSGTTRSTRSGASTARRRCRRSRPTSALPTAR